MEPRDVVPVQVSRPSARATPRIGLNKPLRIEIKDVYTGDHDAGEVLLTTAVKSAASYDAQPLAVQATHKLDKEVPVHLPFRAAEPGSPIVYYTPAVLDRKLTVDVRMDFDRFDRDRYDRYVELIGKALTLPVFVGATALGGPAGAGTAAAAIYAASSGIKVLFRAFDRWRDGTNDADLYSTLSVNLEAVGEVPTSSGYYLCWDDDKELMLSPDGAWSDDATIAGAKGDEFDVDDNGRLIYRGTDRRVDNISDGYVLLHISGVEDDSLKNFQPTAASAALVSKFVGTEGSLVGDIAELAEAYNDFVFLRRISEIDKKLENVTGSEKTKLQEQRAATLKHIQSDAVKNLIESK